jgi:hypothetical protein
MTLWLEFLRGGTIRRRACFMSGREYRCATIADMARRC